MDSRIKVVSLYVASLAMSSVLIYRSPFSLALVWGLAFVWLFKLRDCVSKQLPADVAPAILFLFALLLALLSSGVGRAPN